MVVACNGSPMVIGLGTCHVYVSSETAAFNRHTKNFIAMEDGEIAVITPTECSLDKARIELVSGGRGGRGRRAGGRADGQAGEAGGRKPTGGWGNGIY